MSTSTHLEQENSRLKEANKALEQENQSLHRYLDTVKELYWASQKITSAQNLLYELNQLLYKVMGVVGAKDGSISRLDEETGELIFVLVHGELGQQLPDYRIKSDTGIAGWVTTNRKPIIVNDPRQDPRFSQIVDQEFGFFTNSIVSVPVMSRDKLIGIIQLLNKHNNKFTETDVALLLILGQVTVIIFEEIQSWPETEESEQEIFYL